MDPLFAAYVSLAFALVITPGATTAVVVRNALAAGWRGGVGAACGAAIGNSTHAAVARLGLAVLLSRSPLALLTVQLAGGVYLLWLAISSVRRALAHRSLPMADTLARIDRGPGVRHAFREGIAVNLLNPAIATFYLTVVPSFMPADASEARYLQLAATHVVMAFVVHTMWALGFDRLKHVFVRPAARLTLEIVTAAALLLLSGRVLFDALW